MASALLRVLDKLPEATIQFVIVVATPPRSNDEPVMTLPELGANVSATVANREQRFAAQDRIAIAARRDTLRFAPDRFPVVDFHQLAEPARRDMVPLNCLVATVDAEPVGWGVLHAAIPTFRIAHAACLHDGEQYRMSLRRKTGSGCLQTPHFSGLRFGLTARIIATPVGLGGAGQPGPGSYVGIGYTTMPGILGRISEGVVSGSR